MGIDEWGKGVTSVGAIFSVRGVVNIEGIIIAKGVNCDGSEGE